jgi:hypothetical protein
MVPDDETVLPSGLTLESLFSRGGYRAMMALKRLQPEDYFANRGPVEILQQRKVLLQERPQEFVCEPPMERDCAAVIQFAESLAKVNPVRTLRELGAAWEPDLFCCVARN